MKSVSSLVACNVYVSAGRPHHSEILLSILEQCQERCRNLRIGALSPTSQLYFANHACNAKSSSHPSDTGGSNKSGKKRGHIAMIHAYADGPYDRSSFHLAGDAVYVADVASHVASLAIDGLTTFNTESNNKFKKLSENSQHPLIGLVDHISVMPLLPKEDLKNPSLSAAAEAAKEHEKYNSYIPNDSHGLAATYIGKELSKRGVQVFYYGTSHPDQTPLATIRREKTAFFHSGGLSNDSISSTSSSLCQNQSKEKLMGSCTVGSPSSFVENYNILLSGNVSKNQAMSLTKKIRERDGGIPGVEALTLPYNMGRYEVACNLLRPVEGSTDDISNALNNWVNDHEEKERKKKGYSFYVEDSYRVGTTVEQCIDTLKKYSDDTEDIFTKDYDFFIFKRFRKFLLGRLNI